jgi:CheY-like chemotaxis protein
MIHSDALGLALNMNWKPRVLVVEDDPFVRRATRATLRRLYDVVAVDGVPSALKLLDDGVRFDAIVSDMRMRPASGTDFHETLVARFPAQAARMIFVTGSASEPPVARFLARIPNRCLRKPFEPRALVEAVTAVLSEHGDLVEPP